MSLLGIYSSPHAMCSIWNERYKVILAGFWGSNKGPETTQVSIHKVLAKRGILCPLRKNAAPDVLIWNHFQEALLNKNKCEEQNILYRSRISVKGRKYLHGISLEEYTGNYWCSWLPWRKKGAGRRWGEASCWSEPLKYWTLWMLDSSK